MRKVTETRVEQSHSFGNQRKSVDDDPIVAAFKNARPVTLAAVDLMAQAGGGGSISRHAQSETANICSEPGLVDGEEPAATPIVALGHNGGNYFFIPPSGEFRKMSAEALESGRGVKSLFVGCGPEVEMWCRSKFPTKNNDWCHKQAGLWIVEQCNAKGVFDASSADLRSIGVWRDEDNRAFAHCGNLLVYSDGQRLPLGTQLSKYVTVGSGSVVAPDFGQLPRDGLKEIMYEVKGLWGWKRDVDPAIWLGRVAAAALGGFPSWRAHMYVHGSRGSGKSKLIELADTLLGDLSGEVINDATEAGLRQSRNNHARPLLIDEFEPDNNPRNATRQDNMLALFRRMSGDKGGRISRGGSDHYAVSFRMLGSAYVTSVNHMHLEPQDRSRFIILELGPIPKQQDPAEKAGDLERLFSFCATNSAKFCGRMLQQSDRWDSTYKIIAAQAQSIGADPRQADTANA